MSGSGCYLAHGARKAVGRIGKRKLVDVASDAGPSARSSLIAPRTAGSAKSRPGTREGPWPALAAEV